MKNTPKRPSSKARPRNAPNPVRAFVLIQVLPGRVAATLRALGRLSSVKTVDPVTGPYDIVALLEVRELRDISSVVAGSMGGLRGVTRTTTLLCTS
jgi:DNA-binding Lrp family transcriptional regulator